MPNNLEGQKGSRIFTYNIKIIKVMKKTEKELINEYVAMCEEYVANDAMDTDDFETIKNANSLVEVYDILNNLFYYTIEDVAERAIEDYKAMNGIKT